MTNASLVYHVFGMSLLSSAFLGGAFVLSRSHWKWATLLLVSAALGFGILDMLLFHNEKQRQFMQIFHGVQFVVLAVLGCGTGTLIRYIKVQWEDRR